MDCRLMLPLWGGRPLLPWLPLPLLLPPRGRETGGAAVVLGLLPAVALLPGPVDKEPSVCQAEMTVMVCPQLTSCYLLQCNDESSC